MGFAADPNEFREWCRENTDGEVVDRSNEITDKQEVVCALERNPSGSFQKEITMNEDNYVLFRGEEISTKLRDIGRTVDLGEYEAPSVEMNSDEIAVKLASENNEKRVVRFDV